MSANVCEAHLEATARGPGAAPAFSRRLAPPPRRPSGRAFRPLLRADRRSPYSATASRTSAPGSPPLSRREDRARPTPGASVSPAAAKRRKSFGLSVASGTPARIAAAAIMQSANEPRRRPDSLNRRAASIASPSPKAARSPHDLVEQLEGQPPPPDRRETPPRPPRSCPASRQQPTTRATVGPGAFPPPGRGPGSWYRGESPAASLVAPRAGPALRANRPGPATRGALPEIKAPLEAIEGPNRREGWSVGLDPGRPDGAA